MLYTVSKSLNTQQYRLAYDSKTKLLSDMEIILANINKQLYSWTFKFRKVLRQQILGEVAGFISYAVHFRMQEWQNYWNRPMFAKVIAKRLHGCFLTHGVSSLTCFLDLLLILCRRLVSRKVVVENS